MEAAESGWCQVLSGAGTLALGIGPGPSRRGMCEEQCGGLVDDVAGQVLLGTAGHSGGEPPSTAFEICTSAQVPKILSRAKLLLAFLALWGHTLLPGVMRQLPAWDLGQASPLGGWGLASCGPVENCLDMV